MATNPSVMKSCRCRRGPLAVTDRRLQSWTAAFGPKISIPMKLIHPAKVVVPLEPKAERRRNLVAFPPQVDFSAERDRNPPAPASRWRTCLRTPGWPVRRCRRRRAFLIPRDCSRKHRRRTCAGFCPSTRNAPESPLALMLLDARQEKLPARVRTSRVWPVAPWTRVPRVVHRGLSARRARPHPGLFHPDRDPHRGVRLLGNAGQHLHPGGIGESRSRGAVAAFCHPALHPALLAGACLSVPAACPGGAAAPTSAAAPVPCGHSAAGPCSFCHARWSISPPSRSSRCSVRSRPRSPVALLAHVAGTAMFIDQSKNGLLLAGQRCGSHGDILLFVAGSLAPALAAPPPAAISFWILSGACLQPLPPPGLGGPHCGASGAFIRYS